MKSPSPVRVRANVTAAEELRITARELVAAAHAIACVAERLREQSREVRRANRELRDQRLGEKTRNH
jgi:hypothetical protein